MVKELDNYKLEIRVKLTREEAIRIFGSDTVDEIFIPIDWVVDELVKGMTEYLMTGNVKCNERKGE